MVQFVSGVVNLALQPELFNTQTKKLYLQCRTSLGVVNIILPRISVDGATWGFEIYVNDVDGNASVNNITITPNAADKINGSASPVVISGDNKNASLEIVGVTAWEYSTASSGGGSTIQMDYVESGGDFQFSNVETLISGMAFTTTLAGEARVDFNAQAGFDCTENFYNGRFYVKLNGTIISNSFINVSNQVIAGSTNNLMVCVSTFTKLTVAIGDLIEVYGINDTTSDLVDCPIRRMMITTKA